MTSRGTMVALEVASQMTNEHKALATGTSRKHVQNCYKKLKCSFEMTAVQERVNLDDS